MKKAELTPMYLHTIRGKPAFYDGMQICCGFVGGRHRNRQPLCVSLRQIRREQRSAVEWRWDHGFDADPEDYGYVRVHV